MGKSSREMGPGCLFIFALPFAAVGVFMTWLLGSMLWQWSEMRGWDDAWATIESVELVRDDSGDSTTYSVEAAYSYEYGGATYRGERVSLSRGSDNVGDYQRDFAALLGRHRDNGEPYRCRVDPDEPENSVLDASLRWEMLLFYSAFMVIFGGAGFGMMIASFVMRGERHSKDVLETAHPKEPWRWNPKWESGMISSTLSANLWLSAIFAVFWNALSWPIAILFTAEMFASAMSWLALLVYLFPLIGIGLGIWAVLSFLRWRRFGTTAFEIMPNPGVIGGPVGGFIHVPQDVRPEAGFEVSLKCVRVVKSGSDDDRTTNETTLWEDAMVVSPEVVQSEAELQKVPVIFAAPYEQPQSDVVDDDDKITWRLEASADIPGVDYEAVFEIPVFKTSDSTADYELDRSIRDRIAEPTDDEALFRKAGVAVGHSSTGGITLRFPRARRPVAAVVTTAIGVFFTALVAVLFSGGHPIAGSVVGLIDLLVLQGVVGLWFESRTIRIERDEIGVSGGYFGVGPERTIDRADILRVDSKVTTQSGSVKYSRIFIRTAIGEKVTAAVGVHPESVARRIVELIQGTAGRVTSSSA